MFLMVGDWEGLMAECLAVLERLDGRWAMQLDWRQKQWLDCQLFEPGVID